MASVLHLKGISKRYPGVRALHKVSLELFGGEVHCLVGENGAGKSTLIKVLAGAIRKDEGEIIIDDSAVEINSPADSQSLGIGIIHQDFRLVPELSVAENIFLGREPLSGKGRFIDFPRMKQDARALIRDIGEEIDPNRAVRSLSVAQQQIVEIAKALSQHARILAFDEPSASLTGRELKNLFRLIKRLTSGGVGIIYISHRLDEIFEIGEKVTVLRDGEVVHSSSVRDVDRKALVSIMVGRPLEDEFPNVCAEIGEELLRVEKLNAGKLTGISFTLRSGEILGFAGLVGAGRSELARVIFGADQKDSGTIYLRGSETEIRSPREAIDHGVGFLTEDRNRFGIIGQMNVTQNISLSSLAQLMRGPFIDSAAEMQTARSFIGQLRIKTKGPNENVENLSGGNRQKIVLARWLSTKSRVLMFDEPTAGIDVGAKYEIYSLMNELASEGAGIIMISSDLPELLGMCHRIVVMRDGRVAGEVMRNEATQEKIMALAMLEKAEADSAP